MEFIIKGVAAGKPFTKKVEAKSKNHAIHKVYSLFGSHNGLTRKQIEITEVIENESRNA